MAGVKDGHVPVHTALPDQDFHLPQLSDLTISHRLHPVELLNLPTGTSTTTGSESTFTEKIVKSQAIVTDAAHVSTVEPSSALNTETILKSSPRGGGGGVCVWRRSGGGWVGGEGRRGRGKGGEGEGGVEVVVVVCMTKMSIHERQRSSTLSWEPCPCGHGPRPCTCVQGPKKSPLAEPEHCGTNAVFCTQSHPASVVAHQRACNNVVQARIRRACICGISTHSSQTAPKESAGPAQQRHRTPGQ